MSDTYREFLARKTADIPGSGVKPQAMNKLLRQDQIEVTRRALTRGKYAIFADCGLGKTLDELEWAKQIAERKGKVLILAPLCVGIQTKGIANAFGYEVNLCKTQADVKDGINISNYERLDAFDADEFAGVVLDESSILKNYSGKTRNLLIDTFRYTPYKLACTATPAPNDFMELGNHAEFLGVMTRAEMLAMYFVHDGGDTQTWRLKGHAEKAFWAWVATWSSTYGKPSDLNPAYSDDGFELPELSIIPHVVNMPSEQAGYLFDMPAETLTEQRKIKRASIDLRVQKAAELASDDDYHVFWCDLNDEGDALEKAIPRAQQLKGSMSLEEKEEILIGFTSGQIHKLITKQKITSFGLNWQHCRNTTFVGPNYSYEMAYQAIKRFHRFGQQRNVTAHWVLTNLEYNVFSALRQKMRNQGMMKESLACR